MRSRIVVLVLGLAAGGFATLTAQSQAPGNVTSNPFDLILRKLSQIITTLTPPPGSVKLTTPFVQVAAAESALCSLANVGTETIARLDTRNLDLAGTVIAGNIFFNVLPGQGGAGGSVGSAGFRNCEFTFEGTAAAVRANLLVTAGNVTRISVDAR